MIYKFTSHSKFVIQEAVRRGWKPAARYTNLRDVRHFRKVWFIDIDWKSYDFDRHLYAAKTLTPYLTIAQDVEDENMLDNIIVQAEKLRLHAKKVAIVPKDTRLSEYMEKEVPEEFLFGYSVKTKYGGTKIETKWFRRSVHLLGGRPDVQRKLANELKVVSFDCNRFTLDASFGDYFDGETFRPHELGGYKNCIVDSIKNINKIWSSYQTLQVETGI